MKTHFYCYKKVVFENMENTKKIKTHPFFLVFFLFLKIKISS